MLRRRHRGATFGGLKKVVSGKTKPRVFSSELLVVNEKWSLLRLIDPSYPNRI